MLLVDKDKGGVSLLVEQYPGCFNLQPEMSPLHNTLRLLATFYWAIPKSSVRSIGVVFPLRSKDLLRLVLNEDPQILRQLTFCAWPLLCSLLPTWPTHSLVEHRRVSYPNNNQIMLSGKQRGPTEETRVVASESSPNCHN